MIALMTTIIGLLFLGSCTPEPPSPEPEPADVHVYHYKWISRTTVQWWNTYDSTGSHYNQESTTEPITGSIEFSKISDRTGTYLAIYNTKLYESPDYHYTYDLNTSNKGDFPYLFGKIKFVNDSLIVSGVKTHSMNWGVNEYQLAVPE